MNLSEFAEFLGYDVRTVSSWEKGNSIPGLERALDVANKLKRNVNDIWYLEWGTFLFVSFSHMIRKIYTGHT